ncbi:hypothetical protein ACFWP5_16835 [Streptomyces sp. NPDC058469]|uniref:hypothetical protein n=1 Tax=Streptomyces sp. NPDC058469 TaxID=3346514 RepID=UPI00365E2108
MRQSEPDFSVLEYITITKDLRTGLVLALGGTREAAGILQRTGFLNEYGPRGDYHRLPHGLTEDDERRKATAASHTLLAAGYSVHLDPALNVFDSPDGGREAAQRYLAQLSQRAFGAESGDEWGQGPDRDHRTRFGPPAPPPRGRRQHLHRLVPTVERRRRGRGTGRAARGHGRGPLPRRRQHPPGPQSRRAHPPPGGPTTTPPGPAQRPSAPLSRHL